MYITYMFNWLYDILQLPVPLVLSDNIYSMVTIFDLLMFSIYIAIFIILIRYIITDNLSFSVGGYSMNYSSNAYLPNNIRKSKKDFGVKTDKVKVHSNNSIGGRILNRKLIKSMNKESK